MKIAVIFQHFMTAIEVWGRSCASICVERRLEWLSVAGIALADLVRQDAP